MKARKLFWTAITSMVFFPIYAALADCNVLPPKDVELKITRCVAVEPQERWELRSFVSRYVEGFAESKREQALKEGKETISHYSGALAYEDTGDGRERAYFVPGVSSQVCTLIKEKILKKEKFHGRLSHACCDGDPNPPCLLGTSRIFAMK